MSEKDEKLNKGSFLYINDKEKAEWGYPEGYPYKGIGTILDGTFEFVYNSAFGICIHQIMDENFTIVDGGSYTVIWDGVTYQCAATNYSGSSSPILGNLSVASLGADTGEPFLFMDGIIGATNTAATHTIIVHGETIHSISPDFLPQATQTTHGAIKKAAHVPHVTEAPTSNDFNKLLSALREAGIMS